MAANDTNDDVEQIRRELRKSDNPYLARPYKNQPVALEAFTCLIISDGTGKLAGMILFPRVASASGSVREMLYSHESAESWLPLSELPNLVQRHQKSLFALHFFGTKADLAVAAYDEHWKQKQPEMDRLFSVQIAPLERLSNWCVFVYRSQKEKSQKYGHVCGCPYSSIGAEIATQDDKIRAKVEEIMARSMKYVESAIADAKRDGAITAHDPKAAARHVYSYILGTVLSAKIQNDVEVLKNLEPAVMAIIGAKATVAA